MIWYRSVKWLSIALLVSYFISYAAFSLPGKYEPGFTTGGETEMLWTPYGFVTDKDEPKRSILYFYLPCWLVDTHLVHRTYKVNEMEGWKNKKQIPPIPYR